MIAKPDQLRRHAESMPSGSFVSVERDDLIALLDVIDAAEGAVYWSDKNEQAVRDFYAALEKLGAGR